MATTANAYEIEERTQEDMTMMMLATTGVDFKGLIIFALLIIVAMESLAVLILAFILKDERRRPAIEEKEAPNLEERVPEPPPVFEPPRAPEAPPVPEPPRAPEGPPPAAAAPDVEPPDDGEPPPPPPRITKFIAVTPTGTCFHNVNCPTTRQAERMGHLRILRGCNQCMP